MSLFRFVQWVSEERPVMIYGDGSQARDFTYVDDIARGTLAALSFLLASSQDPRFVVINLGSDRPVVPKEALRGCYPAKHRSAFNPHWINLFELEIL
jgi:nucleoside-diphosphate-sugar epimerase